jgi:hypothetical protein
MKTLEQKIADTQNHLNRLKHKKASENRRADAHRKIELGGIVIASGCEDFDPAELCGFLLIVNERKNERSSAEAKERGLKHFESRKKTSD